MVALLRVPNQRSKTTAATTKSYYNFHDRKMAH